MAKTYAAKLLDCFVVTSVDKGKTIIDTYKKQKNSIIYILDGQVDVTFPKFLSSKSNKNILASLKEIKHNKDNFDTKQLFGLESLKKATSCEKN